MYKYILMMSLIVGGANSFAANGYDGSKQSTLAHARPLIEAFLTEKSKDFGVDLSPVADGYRVRRSLAELVNWVAWPLVGGTRHDYTCRPVDVKIASMDKTARFYVRTTYDADAASLTGRYGEPHFALVRGCGVGSLSRPPALTLWPRTKRLFEDQEIVDVAEKIVRGSRADATDFRHETPSRQVPWDVPDLVDSVYDEPDEDCRSVSFSLPESNNRRTVGVLIRYDVDRPAKKFPAELQTIVHDPKSLRSFRMLVTGGCYGMKLMKPGSFGE